MEVEAYEEYKENEREQKRAKRRKILEAKKWKAVGGTRKGSGKRGRKALSTITLN